MRSNAANCITCIAVGLAVGAVAYAFLQWQGVAFSRRSMGPILFSAAALLAIGSVTYLLLRWRRINAARSPLSVVLFIILVNLLTGVLLTLVTGDRHWLWSFTRAAILAGPPLYGMVWLMRRLESTHLP